MNFIEAIKMVYEKDAVIKKKDTDYCIYKNKSTDCLRKLSFNRKHGTFAIGFYSFVNYENYSLLSDTDSLNDNWVVTHEYDCFITRDNLVHTKLSISRFSKKNKKRE